MSASQNNSVPREILCHKNQVVVAASLLQSVLLHAVLQEAQSRVKTPRLFIVHHHAELDKLNLLTGVTAYHFDQPSTDLGIPYGGSNVHALAQWKGSFSPVAGLAAHLMLPHHGAERNFNKDLISFASKASAFLTVDRADYTSKKRPPQKVRTALGDHFIAVTEKRSLSEISGPSDGAYRAADVMKW
jgi:hypothetical protein